MKAVYSQDLPLVELLAKANNHPDGWQVFLNTLVSHFNLLCCNLYLLNPQSQGIRFQEWSGKKPSDIQLNDYMMNYFHSDTTHSLMFSGSSGDWLTPNLRPDQTTLESTLAYQKWAIPNNFIYSTATTLFKEPNGICALHFSRGAEHPAFTQEEEDRYTALTPFITKAIQLRLKLASSDANNKMLNAIINTFRLPVAILNEFAEVISKNTLMEKITDQCSILNINQGVITIEKQNQDFDLQLTITETIARAKLKPLHYTPKKIVIFIGDIEYTVGVCEISEKSDLNDSLFLGAMIYLIPSTYIDSHAHQDKLKLLFSLTNKEATICSHIMKNTPIKTIAHIENKATTTVREQIQSCYKKTGAANQLELINIIGSIPL